VGAPERIGRYRIVGELGQGAMGTVYLGRDEGLDREVALKVMSKGAASPEDRARFLREGRAAARIQHPNIIVVFELGEHEGMPYMALERLDGVDLERAIKDGLRPDPRLLLNIILQALAGLGHAHDHGIVHRDIKPANIFVPLGLPAKIMDFGVARLAGHQVTTTSGVVTGTPNYMSPEQFQGKKIDGRSDLFSVGLILYELVTGEKAFRSNDIASLFYKIVHEEVDLGLISEGPEWEKLRQVLTRALAKNPDDRYPDAQAMSRDLALALQDLGGSVDLTAPADQILMVRPRPAVPSPVGPSAPASAKPGAAARAARPRSGPAPPRRETPGRAAAAARSGSRAPLVAAGVLGVGALGLLGFAAWLALAPDGTPGSPEPSPGPIPTPVEAAESPAPPESAASEPVGAPTPSPSPRTAAGPHATPAPTPEPAPATPTPAPAPTPVLSHEERLLKADELLQAGHFRAAYDEAKAVQREDPNNEEATVIVQEAEAAMVVEECINKARAALDAGDRDEALREIRRGGEINPNDARLRALFIEATRE
jgi:tetratricopeptide (TPR) repeat protein